MELWFTELQTKAHGITTKVKQTLHSEQTKYQKLDVIETEEFGTMLVLDGMVMTTDKDEFVYHEMMSHVPLFTHPRPKKVLVVGGGDGGTIREVLKHPSVEKAVLVEIDGQVIEYSKKFLPNIAGELDNPRVEVLVDDGFMHIHQHRNEYDVILIDSTEPVGPATKLFERGFYQGIFEALKDEGLFVAQTDNPWFHGDLIRKVFADVKEIFPITRLYTCNVPTYPSGLWTFTIGSKQHDPLKASLPEQLAFETRYYTPEVHKAAFALPKFVKDLTE
ncbi:Spermidine synthase [Caldalkalibacillus thermarum TA2.A1]|uniref:Polyamine aminopropyltransferase n=1 Tax=Caldalkalibacillus thermarum (strain TA2.A1) TaxID=986075 RepID=F5L471_CALTT|nr:polyamine aminopropyltransferase [Caldalkalibacillus thermarum]EGL83859.1 Spermidine synthase [Caldalkalibacillus thermarum TA2.A1]QZT34213.1 polyamine aminopropyltransferase [Caldalkalibacillus thermarum TA2.A1]